MGKGRRWRPPSFEAALRPPAERSPRVETAGTRSDRPSWLLQRIDLAGPWSWRSIAAVDLLRVRERLGHLEAMPFSEIVGRVHHEIPVARLCREARLRLRDLRLDDFDHLLSLRILKRQRVWGVRTGEGVLLLWWDPDHTVFPEDATAIE